MREEVQDLSSERLDALLADSPLGRPFRYYEATPSTQTVALNWSREGVQHGALVLADSQTEGRGRRGRSWEGGSGKSIMASVLLRPAWPSPPLGLIGGAIAVALAETLSDQTGCAAQTKWPNDVWIGEKKVAGVLPDALWRGATLEGVVAGIGLNVNQRESDLPRDARHPPTSLYVETQKEWDRGVLLQQILFRLDQELHTAVHSPQTFLKRWEEMERTLNCEVEAIGASQGQKGVVRGILPDGSLHLESDDGVERRLHWGEISIRPTKP